MHLYVIAGRVNIDVPDVCLTDGYKPLVCGFQPVDVNFEPAIWFKVMVLDAITVDCDSRRLSWIPLTNNDVANFAALDSGIALCGSCRLSGSSPDDGYRLMNCTDDSLYEQLDYAFDAASHLVSKYESNEISKDEFGEQLMRLLHVHVLPNIRLTSRDADCIAACIISLEKSIENIDKDVLVVVNKMTLAEQSLAKLRKRLLSGLLPDVKSGRSVCPVLSAEFIDLLLSKSGIEKDIAEVSAAVDRAQYLLGLPKDSSTDNDAPVADNVCPDELYAERDRLLALKEKLTEMRRSRRGISKRVKDAIMHRPEDPQHQIYLGIVSKLDEFRSLNHLLARKKLLVTSVKEAARLALKDVQSGCDSFGLEVDCLGAANSTDVLGEHVKPPWQSLAKQIASLLANSEGKLAALHRNFCRHISDVCSATIVEKQLYDASMMAFQRSSEMSASGRITIRDSGTQSSSSDTISERGFSLRESCSSAVSLSSDILRRPAESAESDSSLVRSLPLMQTQESDSSNSVFNFHAASHISEKADKKFAQRRKAIFSLPSRNKSNTTPSFISYIPDRFSCAVEDDVASSPVIIVDRNNDCVRVALESLRDEVLDHFDKMCKMLQSELAGTSGKWQYQQVWLDYESYFYQEMMSPLIDLYRLQYTVITDVFCNSLLTLTPDDLGLDEAALINLLQGYDDDLSEYSFPVVDSVSTSSTDTLAVVSSEGNILSASESDLLSGDDLSQILRTHSEQRRKPKLRTMRISMPIASSSHSPTAVLVYERTLSPVSQLPDTPQSRPDLSEMSMKMKQRYRDQFSVALRHIELAIQARTPGLKLRYLTDCLRETTKQLSEFYASLFGSSSGQSSCDELLDVVVILLCNIDGRQMASLYCQLSLLADMMAPWLVRGPYSFTLVQFTGACQFIQERLMLKRNRQTESTV